MAAKSVLVIAVVVAVISMAAAEDTGRSHGPSEQCPKQGLCPFVRHLVTDVHPVHPVTHVHPSPAVEHPVYPVHPVNPGHPVIPVHPVNPGHPIIPVHPGGHGPSVGHPVPTVFFYPHHVYRRDAPPAHHASVCGNLCSHDHQCPGTKKCCATECGFSCFDAVHIAH